MQHESEDEQRCFTVVRASHPALMISFATRSGTLVGFAYSHLYRSALSGNRLSLIFTSDLVELLGRNLDKLYRPLNEGRVTLIREARVRDSHQAHLRACWSPC